MVAKSSLSQEKRSLKSKPVEFSAVIRISQRSGLVHDILEPEMKQSEWLRSSYELKMNKDVLEIKVTASDMTAFKATCMMILKRADLALKVANGSN